MTKWTVRAQAAIVVSTAVRTRAVACGVTTVAKYIRWLSIPSGRRADTACKWAAKSPISRSVKAYLGIAGLRSRPPASVPWRKASAVSGMLSKTAEMKPSASAETHEAGGNCSTGIIEAQSTSESRKIEPLMVSGINSQS